ncbi:MAG TPA: hypothetical protein VMU65_10520 [Candidatus Saccharimonadales bacterium]|nr:hypothetical protein [Candidatus Saccharimonadales bacterium]
MAARRAATKVLPVVLGIVLLACTSAGVALASGNPLDQGYTRPSDSSSVNIFGCFKQSNFQGGSVTVPAGLPFVVYGGWSASTIGEVRDWLNGTTNMLSVGGGPSLDMTPYFLGLTHEWNPPYWSDIFFYPVGALAAGDTVTIAWTMDSSRPMPDGATNFPGRPPAGGVATFTCTVTGGA